MHFEIKKLHTNDVTLFQQLINVFEEVFEIEHPEIPTGVYLEKLLSKSDFVAMVVINNQQVVAGLTAYELHMYYAETSEMFLYDIAVQANFQRKGLGKTLLQALEQYCKEKSIKTMFVAAHEEDTHALDFYHATGGRTEKVRHFSYEISLI
jgi:aminoglycoside 3-N-acetyltransferase I